MEQKQKDVERLAKQQFILGMVYASKSIENELTNRSVSYAQRVTNAIKLCKKYTHPNLANLSTANKEKEIESDKQ